MATPDQGQVSWLVFTLGLLIQTLLCLPAAAGTPPAITDRHGASSSSPAQMSTDGPATIETAILSKETPPKNELRARLDEARDILEDLRLFADTAQRTLRIGREIKALHAENDHIRQAITDAGNRHDLVSKLAKIEAQSSTLARNVLTQWLISEQLRHQQTVKDDRLALTRSAWLATKNRVTRLQNQLAEHRQDSRNLRAKTATLAAEIGRTRREIISLKQETHLANHDRRAIEAITRQLRQNISAGLRTMLLSD